MSEPSRIEKMVGTIIGLHMIMAQLVAAEAARSGDGPAYLAELRRAAQAMLEPWPIGSDTAQGMENIRRSAADMIAEFPGPPLKIA